MLKRIILIGLCCFAPMHAWADGYWSGGGTDGLYTNTANWQSGLRPGAGELVGFQAVFDGYQTNINYDVPDGYYIGRIVYSGDAPQITFNGPSNLSIGIVMASWAPRPQTFNCGIVPYGIWWGDQWLELNTYSFPGSLVFNGGMHGSGGYRWYLGSSGGILEFASAITGNVSMVMTNATVLMSASNSFDGSIQFSAGTLWLSNSYAIACATSVSCLDGSTVLNYADDYAGGYFLASGRVMRLSGPGGVFSNCAGLVVGASGRDSRLDTTNVRIHASWAVIGQTSSAVSNRVLLSGSSGFWTNAGTLTVGGTGAWNSLVLSGGAGLWASNLLVGSNVAATNNMVDIQYGTVVVERLSIPYPSSTVRFSAGYMECRSAAVSSGVPLVVGNGFSNALFRLAGAGPYSFSGGFGLNTNAVLRGTGTVFGAVTLERGSRLFDTNDVPGTLRISSLAVRSGASYHFGAGTQRVALVHVDGLLEFAPSATVTVSLHRVDSAAFPSRSILFRYGSVSNDDSVTWQIEAGNTGSSGGRVVNNTRLKLIELLTTNAPPVIFRIDPVSTNPGAPLLITGAGFSTNTQQQNLHLGGVSIAATDVSTTNAQIVLPGGAFHGPVSIVNTSTFLAGRSSQQFFPTFNGNGNTNVLMTRVLTITNNNQQEVAVGDFNGDGKPDIMLTPRWLSGVYLCRNTSVSNSISFASPQQIGGNYPRSVAVLDFNGDGKLDFYVSGNVDYVYVNRTANLAESFSFDMYSGSSLDMLYDLNVADLNADGRPDIVGVPPDIMAMVLNTSTQGVALRTVDYGPITVAGCSRVADLDGDDRPDVVLGAPWASTGAYVRLNRTTSSNVVFETWPAALSIPSGVKRAGLADLDGDDRTDIVIGVGSNLYVFRNTSSNGDFSVTGPQVFTNTLASYQITFGDVNGDGRPDVLMGTFSDAFMLRLNTSVPGSISLAACTNYPCQESAVRYHQSVAVADLDGDKRPDVIVGGEYSGIGYVSVFRNDSPFVDVPSVATLAATNVLHFSAALNGEVNPNGSNTIVYFEYGSTAAYGSTIAADQSPITGAVSRLVSATLNGLAMGQTYHYRVCASNFMGLACGDDATFTALTNSAPATPTLVSPVNCPDAGDAGPDGDNFATYGRTLSHRPKMIWSVPADSDSNALHFAVYYDGVNAQTLVSNSASGVSGFEFYNGAAWSAMPTGGVPGTNAAFRLRFKPPADLLPAGSTTAIFWRVTAHDPLTNSLSSSTNRFVIGGRTWTDPALSLGGMIRVSHISELREEANYGRVCRAQASSNFTDPSLQADATKIRALHISELRASVQALTNQTGEALAPWTDATVVPNITPIRTNHVIELRRALETVN